MIYVPNEGAATDPHCMFIPSSRCFVVDLIISGYNTTPNTLAMAEIFTAVIVSTIMTMRPCFQVVFSGIATTVTSTSRTRRTRMNSSGVMDTTTSQKRKVDRQGFSKIGANKTEVLNIELQSRDRSTEELFAPGQHPSRKLEEV